MNTEPFPLTLFLSLFATYVPTLLVCLVAGVIIMGRWRDIPAAAPWAAFGYGLVFVLCFVMPLAQTFLQRWVFQGGLRETRAWAFTAFGIVGALLHAVIYLILFMAIMAGRPKTDGV